MLHSSLMSFFIPDHKKMLISAKIFVEPGCPMSVASAACFPNCLRITILYPANSKPNSFVSPLKTGNNSWKAHSFWLFLKEIFNWNSFRSTKVLLIRVFMSTMKLNFFFSRYFSDLAFLILGFSIMCSTWV